VFRTWLISLLNRPRVPEDTKSDAHAAPIGDSEDTQAKDPAFQPIRSQEDILKEEAAERASSRRNRVISRFFDDTSTQRVKSRP